MRIALVRQRYVPQGGAERVLGALLRELGREGHEVHVVAHRWDAAMDGPAAVHRVPLPPGPSFLRAWAFARLSARVVSRLAFDLVHSFDRTLRQDVYRAGDGCHREWLVQRRRCGLGRWDGVNPLHRVLLSLEARIFGPGGTPIIIVNSDRVGGEVRRHYGTAHERIRLIRNGVDLARFHPDRRRDLRGEARARVGLGPEPLALLFAGSGFERKGLRHLIVGVAEYGRRPGTRPVEILVAGKGDPRPYQRLARSVGLGAAPRFLGISTRLEELHAAADAFVLPTLYDPAANATLEAMASGLPAITTRMDGASEIIEPGRSGIVLEDPADGAALGDALSVLAEPATRKIMGREARRVAEAYPVGRVARETLKVYEEVRGHPRPRGTS